MPRRHTSKSGLPRAPGISTAILGEGDNGTINLSFGYDPARQARLKAAAPVRWNRGFRIWQTGLQHRDRIEAFLIAEGKKGQIGRPQDLFHYALAS